MFDLTKWATNEMLEDFVKKPITISVKDFSQKYDIEITIQTKKKEGE